MADPPIEPSSRHLRTNIYTGGLSHAHDDDQHQVHEWSVYSLCDTVNEKTPANFEEDDDSDIDALIAELESEDGESDDEEEATPGMSATPEELLNVDRHKGLTSWEVIQRRRKYGLNQMKAEKVNLIKKFLMYFVGRFQFIMEVCPFFYLAFVLGGRYPCS